MGEGGEMEKLERRDGRHNHSLILSHFNENCIAPPKLKKNNAWNYLFERQFLNH
jgi:hypothetical protein